MRAVVVLLAAFLSVGAIFVSAQDDSPQLTTHAAPAAPTVASTAPSNPAAASPDALTVPAGTRVPLTMKQGLTTKNARAGDPVYAQTAFPIVMNDRIVIPPGTFVQGEIRRVQRPGRVKGRAELQMSFSSMIFPNGYTLML